MLASGLVILLPSFRKATGSSFSKYLTEIRVRHAQKLLLSENMNVSDIALDCGFRNIANFYRQYRKVTGHTLKQDS